MEIFTTSQGKTGVLVKAKASAKFEFLAEPPSTNAPKWLQGARNSATLEGDLMTFKKNSQHILVLRERKTMFTISLPLPNKKACNTAQAIIHAMQALPPEARKTLTLDNGGEFARHSQVCKDLGLKTFFCDPYASWQKGGVENTNGRLRRDLPRNTNIRTMYQEDFQENIDNYNQTLKTKTSNGFHHLRFSTKIYNVSHFKLECG